MDTLKKVIKDLEEMNKVDNMISIKRRIKKFNVGETDILVFSYEALAFNFHDEQENGFGKGCYFGSGIAINSLESTELDEVNSNVIDYWKKRAEESHNDILKARYSDLIWEMSKIFKVDKAYTFVLKAIDAYLEIVRNQKFNYTSELIKVSERALNLAISLNDSNRIDLAKKEMIEMEGIIAVDKSNGTWGFSFDNLFDNKKINLSQTEEDTIICMLEKRLNRLLSVEGNLLNPIESAIIRIVSYYQKKEKVDKVSEFLKKLESAYQRQSTKGNVFTTESNLQKLLQLYQEYGLNNEASRILVEISSLGPLINESLIHLQASTEIQKEDLKNFLNVIVQGDIEKDVINVCLELIPKNEEMRKQVSESKSLVSKFFSTTILSSEGTRASTISNIEEDLEGYIIKNYADVIEERLDLIDLVLKEFIKKHSINSEKLLDILIVSPAFDKRKIEILKKGIDFYFEEEYIASIHVLIPQIENALRNIIRICKGNTIKTNPIKGGFDVITLSEILKSDILLEIYKLDIMLYLKTILNDSRGLNLRNIMLHGLSGINIFNEKIASLIIQVVLIISLFKEELDEGVTI